MFRLMWMLFILTMALVKSDPPNYADKDPRFLLPLFDLRNPDERPPERPPYSNDDSDRFPAYEYSRPQDSYGSRFNQNERCATRMETALDHIKKRQQARAKVDSTIEMIDLSKYRLYQQMRSVPFDMYVTRMRVRLPQNHNWVRVEKCYYDPRNSSLDTMLLFRDLTISGSVNLYDGANTVQDRGEYKSMEDNYKGDIRYKAADLTEGNDYDDPNIKKVHTGDCNMILRLRKAGIGFHTHPLSRTPGQFSIKTDSEFVEPGFISVYAYGCERYLNRANGESRDLYKRSDNALERNKRDVDELEINMGEFDFETQNDNGRESKMWERNTEFLSPNSKLFGPDDRLDEYEDISREMEDIFAKGIRSMLTTYMKRELQPAIKETLMKNMGYTVSYG